MLRKKIGWSVNKWVWSLFVVLFAAQSFGQGTGKNFVVTNTNDSGEGSLRAAIEASNENSEGPNQIVFKLEAGSGSEIEISKPLVINSKTTLNGKIGNKNITIIGNEEINGISIYDITDVTVKNVTVKGCNYGVYAVRALDVKVDSSEFVENDMGFYCASGRFEVSNSLASGNRMGIGMSQPMFAGGTTIGMNVHDLTVRNCIIGLNKSCTAVYPNETGIYIYGSSLFPKIFDCVIAGNTKNGIDLYAHSARIAKNYIGMNRSFKDFGNGENGVALKENGGNVILGSVTDRDSCNYIGFNKEYGVGGQSGKIYNNYIGLVYDKERDTYIETPNEMGGVNHSYGIISSNVVGYNKGNGIETSSAKIENNVVGGDGEMVFANEGYGIVTKTSTINGNKVFSNKLGGIQRVDYYGGYEGTINVTNNLFGDQPFAYNEVSYGYKPEITSVKDNGATVTVSGTVKFSDRIFSMPDYLDDEKVGIELYISEGKESAVEYVGYVDSDKDGNWTYEVKKSEFNTKKYFTATAIHYEYSQGQYLQNHNMTSALAEPKSLIPDAKAYYVKVNAVGIGDGSTWENAMSAEDFAFWLPRAKDDVTFYVAEGNYAPTSFVKNFDVYPWNLRGYGHVLYYYPSYTINSKVSIVGGFEKDAKTGAVANPDKYKTAFTYIDPKALADAWPNFPADLFESSKYDSFNQLFEKSCTSMFVVKSGASASMDGVTVCGLSYCRSGIILNEADLNLNKTTFEYIMGQYDGGGCAGIAMVGNCNVNVDSCSFRNLIGSYTSGVITTNYRSIDGSSKITIKNSAFKDTYSKYSSGLISLGENSSLLIENSTFDGAGDDGVNGNFEGGIVRAINADVTIKNSTIANVSAYRGGVVKADNSDVELFNNTVINVKASYAGSYIFAEGEGKLNMVGNLVSTTDNDQSFIFMATEMDVTDKNNVYVNPGLTNGGYASVKYPMDESTVITFDDLDSFVDGKYDDEAKVFIPNVEKHGAGYTPTIALTKDMLPSGKSVRFALSNTVVDTDQNGVSRLSNTCVGAYELIPDAYTLVVTNEQCEGEGSFRNAILTANKLDESIPVSIVFDFEGKGTKTICLDATVTMNRGNLTIDGSTYPDSIVIKAADNSFEGLRFVSCANNITLKGLAFEGFFEAVHFLGIRNVSIDSCTFDSNYIGIYNQSSDVTVEKSIFTNNDKGFYSSYIWIVDCKYTYRSIIKNNIFGLSADQKSAKPNKIGIHIGGTSSGSSGEHELRIHNNVISGNSENGILAAGAFANNSYGLITKNLIGTNKYGEDFGNGANGIFTEIPAGSLYIGTNGLDSANVIVYNHENGVSAINRNPLNVRANYIGMSSDLKPMPNQGSGVYTGVAAYISNCYIGFNKKDGVEVVALTDGGYTTYGRGYVSDCFIGGDGENKFGNEGYGVSGCNIEISRNNIWNNKLGGVYKECENKMYPSFYIKATQNLFGGDQPFAISDENKDINVPENIKFVEISNGDLEVRGNIRMLDAANMEFSMPKYLDEKSAIIELFSNEGVPETAYKYEGVVESDENGDFVFVLPNAEKYENTCFTTTATFKFIDDYGIGTNYYTSVLSEPSCVVLSNVEEIASDNVMVYPNPASDRIVLSNATDAQFVIYNALGQKVLSGVSDGSEINVSSLSAGVYRLDVANVGQETIVIRK